MFLNLLFGFVSYFFVLSILEKLLGTLWTESRALKIRILHNNRDSEVNAGKERFSYDWQKI
jgi:hypothetical protein